MPPKGRIWQQLTWSWAYSTGDPACDRRIEAAAKAAWSYALLCAWTYLNDREAAQELMEHAVQNASGYVLRHPEASPAKLAARLRSVIRRRAKQVVAKRRWEIPSGSLQDLENFLVEMPDAEQRVYANEVLAHLSPFAQSILNRRVLGYTWREIAQPLNMDHTAVRRAYFRELEILLRNLTGSGEPSCD